MKTHIDAALEPLLQRISALETENQEIKAILKAMPQPKVVGKNPPPQPNNTASNSFIKLRHKENYSRSQRPINREKASLKKIITQRGKSLIGEKIRS